MIKKSFRKRNWYKKYYENHYKNKNKFRDDPFNKETLFQFLANKKSFINSITKIPFEREKSKMIDIGCGSCSQLISLVSLGFKQENLFGIDINKFDVE